MDLRVIFAISTSALLLLTRTGAAAPPLFDFRPPIVNEADFGPAETWLGFPVDGSEVRYAPDFEDWWHLPGGLVCDHSLTYRGRPTGRLVSLAQGYLAFRPIALRQEWDFIEFAVHNETPGDGAVQLRLYYGLGGPEQFWSPRHGFFFYEIPLGFAGWKTFRLEREDFQPYGGPIGWLDEQLVGLGLHVTHTPAHLTEVRLADVHLARSPIMLSADRDLQQTTGAPLTFRLTAHNRGSQGRHLHVSVSEDAFAYSTHKAPFAAAASLRALVVPPRGRISFTLTAKPRHGAAPGDAVTYVVAVNDEADPIVSAKARVHAVMWRPHPALHRAADLAAGRAPDPKATFPDPPGLDDAAGVLYWAQNAGRAYAVEGNLAAGKKLADTLRKLGDPAHGYPALCTQPFYPMTGHPGVEPPFEKLKTWYQAFHWSGPIQVARGYDLIYNSGLLTERDKRRIEGNFLRPLGRQTAFYLNACANGQEQRITSTLAIGLVTQDPDLIRAAIDGALGWKHAIGHDMLNGITMEGTLTYMWYITWPILADGAEMASASGIDLFHMPCPVITDRNHVYDSDLEQPSHNSVWQCDTQPEARSRTFMDCLRGMIAITYPDWHFPKENDTEDDAPLPIPTPYFRDPLCRDETAALLADTNPQLAEGYGDRFSLPQQPGSLKRPSCNLQAIGWAILRNDDGNKAEDQYLLLDYGPHGGSHGHRDKLQFIYWRHGKELAPDLPICDLDVPAWSQYYQQTASHNTIILDGKSQLPSAGERCLTFTAVPGAQVAEVEGVAAYAAQQARVRRLALMTRDYVLLVDRVISPLPHTIDFVIHGAGKGGALTTSVPLTSRGGLAGDADGYRFITLSGEAATTGPWEANWDIGDGVELRLISLGGEAARVLVGKGFEGYRRGHRPNSRRLPAWEGPDETLPDAVLIARREAPAGTTRFVTLLEGHKGQSAVASAEAQGDSVRILLRDGAIETFTWNGSDQPGKPAACQFLREERGAPAQVALLQGHRVTVGGRILLSSDRRVAGCAVQYQGDEAHITASKPCVLELLPPRPIRRVLVNGREVKAPISEGGIRVDVTTECM